MTTTNEGDKRLLADVAAVEKCGACGGSGLAQPDGKWRSHLDDCPECAGTGRKPLPGDPVAAWPRT